MMLQVLVKNFYSTSIKSATNTSLLATLRKNTGYPIINCKKALEQSENDLQKAEEWLHARAQAEGWAKATKLQDRTTAQGLMGVAFGKNRAAVVELNCETDFVARNKRFQVLVSTVAADILYHLSNNEQDSQLDPVHKVTLSSGELSGMPWQEFPDKHLSDLVALNIGQLGENMVIRRAMYLRVAEGIRLGCYTHPRSSPEPGASLLGKYAALVAIKETSAPEETSSLTTDEFCQQLGMHIVGMNPQSLGSLSEIESSKEQEARSKTEPLKQEPTVIKTSSDLPESSTSSSESSSSSNESSTSDSDSDSESAGDSLDMNENRLYQQTFLMEPGVTVREVALRQGVEIVDFVRFHCGGSLEESVPSGSTTTTAA